MEHQHEEDTSDLQRVWPLVAQQASKASVKAKPRDDRQAAISPNDVWAMDFVHDQLATGKKLRILTVVDTRSRYCPATDARFNYRDEDVVPTLERVCTKTGYPKSIRVEPASRSRVLLLAVSVSIWAIAGEITSEGTTALHRVLTLVGGFGFTPANLRRVPRRGNAAPRSPGLVARAGKISP
jgi:putative transposase